MIIRSPRPESQFLMISNEVLRDERLSYRARGLLAAILSHTDNWRVNSEDLTKHGLEGRGAVRAALSELEKFGYLLREKVQNEKGQWITNSYIFDKPQRKDENVDSPTTGLPKVDFRSSVSRSLLEEPLLNTIKNKEEEIDQWFNEFWNAYPIHNGGHANSLKAFSKALKKATAEEIILGTQKYRDDPNRTKEFTAYPATWLNQERWADPPLPPQSLKTGARRVDNSPTIVPLQFSESDRPKRPEMPSGWQRPGKP